MAIKSNEDKILEKQLKIEQSEEKIKAEQEKINTLKKEIEEIRKLEIQGLIKEINLPFDELKKFLIDVANKPKEGTK